MSLRKVRTQRICNENRSSMIFYMGGHVTRTSVLTFLASSHLLKCSTEFYAAVHTPSQVQHWDPCNSSQMHKTACCHWRGQKRAPCCSTSPRVERIVWVRPQLSGKSKNLEQCFKCILRPLLLEHTGNTTSLISMDFYPSQVSMVVVSDTITIHQNA
jgi:hypothetical protein